MLHRTLVAYHQPPRVVPPAAAALHLPALAVAGAGAEGPATFGPFSGPAHPWRNRGLEAPPPPIAAEGLPIVGLVRHQLLGTCSRPAAWRRPMDGGQRGFRPWALVGLGPGHGQAHRHAAAGRHHPYVAALPDFRLTNGRAPFVAGTPRPSRKAWAPASWLWASSRLSSARHTRAQVPSGAQTCRRRQQVVGEPSSRGTASQAQPVLSTCTMPLPVRRSSARRRPGPGFGVGRSGSMMVQWSSVRSCRLMPTA